MTWISKTTTFFGLVLLAHACYSAQEHSALQSFRTTSAVNPASPGTTAVSLPLDISLETLVATAIICFGLALGTPPLRPIQWRVWAGKIEREGEEGFMNADGEVSRDYVGNPFKMLETRPGFVDIRRQKKEFAEWVRSSGEKQEVQIWDGCENKCLEYMDVAAMAEYPKGHASRLARSGRSYECSLLQEHLPNSG